MVKRATGPDRHLGHSAYAQAYSGIPLLEQVLSETPLLLETEIPSPLRLSH